MRIRPLKLDDMDAAAAVHSAAFDHALPWLAGLQTPDEDRRFYRDHVYPTGETWGAELDENLVGLIAFHTGWVDQLYVLPRFTGRGIGTLLLDIAKSVYPNLELWTHLRNTTARRFYENRGFVAQETTDGSRNQEQEPDVRYCWSRTVWVSD